MNACKGEADRVRREFTEMSQAEGLNTSFKIRHGDPLKEILEELRQTVPDLLITGGKQLSAWGRFRSRNLPSRLQKKTATPISVIPVIDDQDFEYRPEDTCRRIPDVSSSSCL